MSSTSPATVDDFLGTRRTGVASWAFSLGRELHGAFGGVFGGAVAACALRVARDLAPSATPSSLDVRFLRGLSTPGASATGAVLHPGRSLTTASVDITDEAGRPAAHATIGMVSPGALHPLDRTEEPLGRTGGFGEGEPISWSSPGGVEIPIVATLRPRLVGRGPWGIATGLTVPWDDAEASAEAVCFGADMCVGPPVAAASIDRWIPHPNPDLSVRFVGQVGSPDLVAVGRLERVVAGLAAVTVGVWSGANLVGIGVSTSMLLATKKPG